ncbi:hypothetical protein pipiens_005561 [Culex pipiens pipiens]|uniref:Serpin domain-containing protein n=2 Tax=Culex pipiens pipiens TaxID=38569 RepID=A0ABD1DVX6_CULPP
MLSQILSTCVLIDSAAHADDDDSDSPVTLVRACNRFSVRYFKNCFNPTENILCSPVVVRLGLSSFYQVSGTPIEEDLRTVLHLPADKSVSNSQQIQLHDDLTSSGALKIHTMICTSETRPLDACFQDHLANHAPPVVLEPVDFTDDVSTARAVNGWIQSKRCEIDDLVTEGDVWSLEPLSVMMFNAVSLMTKWRLGFDPRLTELKEFRFLNKVQRVSMMHGIFKARYCYDHQMRCKVLELPFEQSSNYNLLMILPDDGQCLADVVDAIPEDYLNTVNDSLTEHWVDVHIPTITVAMKTSVKDVLSKLDCAGIFELKDLKVFADGKDQLDRFYQHCWFRMDENGAQTNAPLAESPQVTFTADRPFLFVIRKGDDSAVVMIGDYSIYVGPDEQF